MSHAHSTTYGPCSTATGVNFTVVSTLAWWYPPGDAARTVDTFYATPCKRATAVYRWWCALCIIYYCNVMTVQKRPPPPIPLMSVYLTKVMLMHDRLTNHAIIILVDDDVQITRSSPSNDFNT